MMLDDDDDEDLDWDLAEMQTMRDGVRTPSDAGKVPERPPLRTNGRCFSVVPVTNMDPDKVPNELWLEIFERIPSSYDLHSVSLCSTRFYRLTLASLHRGVVWRTPTAVARNLALWNTNPGLEIGVHTLEIAVSTLPPGVGGRVVSLDGNGSMLLPIGPHNTQSAARLQRTLHYYEMYERCTFASQRLHEAMLARVKSFVNLSSLNFTNMLIEESHFELIHALPRLRALRFELCIFEQQQEPPPAAPFHLAAGHPAVHPAIHPPIGNHIGLLHPAIGHAGFMGNPVNFQPPAHWNGWQHVGPAQVGPPAGIAPAPVPAPPPAPAPAPAPANPLLRPHQIHKNLPITELTMLNIRRRVVSEYPNRHVTFEDHISHALSLATARDLQRLTVDCTADVFRCIYTSWDAESHGWTIPATLRHVYVQRKHEHPDEVQPTTMGETSFPDTSLYTFCQRAPQLETVSTFMLAPPQHPIAPDVLPQLARFSGPVETAQAIAATRPIEALGLTRCGVGGREGVSALGNIALSRPALKMLFLEFKQWDDEVIHAVSRLFPALRRLKIVFFDGEGPDEIMLVKMAPEFLCTMPHLHTFQLYALPARNMHRPEYPTVLFDDSYESLEDELRNIVIPWNRYCPALRKVQLLNGYVLSRTCEIGKWTMEKLRRFEDREDLEY